MATKKAAAKKKAGKAKAKGKKGPTSTPIVRGGRSSR